jgi:DNA repair protein RecO (recombination protein O)
MSVMQQIDQAYVLSVRPYRENSALVKLFSERSGVISAVARSVYQSGHNAQRQRSALQLANRLEVSYKPSQSLYSIYSIDLLQPFKAANTKNFVLLSYINELLARLLPEGAELTELYSLYTSIIDELSLDTIDEALLRRFEFFLLNELGFDFDWYSCAETGSVIEESSYYAFFNGRGFIRDESEQALVAKLFSGVDILAMAEANFSQMATQKAAKKLFRQLIAEHLGQKPLRSRELYKALFN